MKPFVEKLPLADNTSFVARTYRTPHFEVGWHQHIEYEAILFLEGEGMAYIGNYAGPFKPGDLFLLGSNLPHTFQKSQPDMVTSALVVQFRRDCWGPLFFNLPECEALRLLLEAAGQGLRITNPVGQQLQASLARLEQLPPFRRMIRLWETLFLVWEQQAFQPLSTHDTGSFFHPRQERISLVFQYTSRHFAEPVTLAEVAGLVNMSITAFCNYFRKSTKQTYVAFLNEIRVGNACRQLIDTDKTVKCIALDCGYNSLANFNRQFLRIKGVAPGDFRKSFSRS